MMSKKSNMAYWDEIDNIMLQAVKDIAVMSTSGKQMTEENEEEDDTLNIAKAALDVVIPLLKNVGYEFLYVDENY